MDPRVWRKLGGGGFPQKSLSFNMAHLAVVETGIYTTAFVDPLGLTMCEKCMKTKFTW